jgi:2-aminoethylphosphonate transport system substrate-binding protein
MRRARATRHGSRAAVALLVSAIAVAGCSASAGKKPAASSTTQASADPCAGTSFGSQVVLYSATGLEYWYEQVLSSFETDCGVRVVFITGTSAEMERRLEVEKAKPYADVIVAEAPEMATADAAGLLDPLGDSLATGVPASRCGRGRHWCDVVENYLSWIYNSKLVTNPPRTWQDLLAPRFAGQVLLSRLDQTSDGLAQLTLLNEVLGRDAALQYLTQLEASVRSHWVNTDTMSRLVSAGSALVANGNLRENLNDTLQYHHLKIWFPAEGSTRTTLADPFGGALVRGGRNRGTADALLKFMWSKDAQAAVSTFFGGPARTDVVRNDCRSRDVRQELAGVRVLRPDWGRVAREQSFLVPAWLDIKRAPDGVPPPPTSFPLLQPC